MARYDIFVLGEGDVTVSGGGQLDGVTQGSGVHLQGRTITLNSNAWQAIQIDDNDDNFEDSDSSQRLTQDAGVGNQTVDGVSYAPGSVVEAEYGVDVTDGTNTWTLVGFNVNNSNPAYGTIEGLAFIGGPGGFPPVGVPLTVTRTFEGPNFAAADYATPICVASGTRIDTPDGPRAVEDIAPGDLVMTRDGGARPVRWVGARGVRRVGSFASVQFAAGAIGNDTPLETSQQHRVLVQGWKAELLFGCDEVLVAAVHLVNDRTVRMRHDGMVVYHHLLLDDHAVIRTNGAWTESLHPGKEAIDGLLPHARAEVLAIFPELEATGGAQRTCLPTLRGYEAAALSG